jgi:lipoprotein-anchoring transpeptidase ErfK/SrfK
LSTQTVTAFEGDTQVYQFLISSGKWFPTPTGTFHIWGKFRYILMSGGDPALHDDYYLPNVPYVMFFGGDGVPDGDGFSLHGTYWHNNFGHPMSHGCVNMRTEDAAKLFAWTTPTVVGDANYTHATKADPGTTVHIFGTPPAE